MGVYKGVSIKEVQDFFDSEDLGDMKIQGSA
jgi:hypothetical protein